MVYVFQIFYSISIGPITWIFLGEIFPNRIREYGMAPCVAVCWAFNLLWSKLQPIMILHIGWKTWMVRYQPCPESYNLCTPRTCLNRCNNNRSLGLSTSSLRFTATFYRRPGTCPLSRWMSCLEQSMSRPALITSITSLKSKRQWSIIMLRARMLELNESLQYSNEVYSFKGITAKQAEKDTSGRHENESAVPSQPIRRRPGMLIVLLRFFLRQSINVQMSIVVLLPNYSKSLRVALHSAKLSNCNCE